MARRCRNCFALVAAVASLPLNSHCVAQNKAAGPQNQIVSPIVDADTVTLWGNSHPLALPEFDRGALPIETRLERMVLLLQRDAGRQQALDALVEAQHDPTSRSYRQWLSPEEFGSRFGASDSDLARLTDWLKDSGFAVEPVPAGRSLILFSGTAGQVAEAFHTEIHRYEVNGAIHIANSADPQIPRTFAPVVAGIVSLHDFRRVSAIRSLRPLAGSDRSNRPDHPDRSEPENTQGSAHYILPADFAAIYDLNPQYAAGREGSGSSIAIAGRSNIDLSDVNSFRSYAGLPGNQPTVILDGVNPGLVSGDQDESTLDVEWSGGVAPGAAIKLVAAASTVTSNGVDLAAQYIVNHKTATVMSTSYGSCEAEMGSTEMAFYNSLWEQAASEGISVFVASGDSGAAGCNVGSDAKGLEAGVNGMCSSPYSTCVGGTEFDEGSGEYWASANGAGGGSALSYIPEKVWNESSSDGGSGLWSSGGGVSAIYLQPDWQKGIPGANSNGMRAVPDVALTAASHDGYLISENGAWYAVSGTSASSPAFAGIMSLVVQRQGGVGQGSANPALYGLVDLADASENPFHPTPAGNNSVPGVTGFTASGAAYNLATGLGSVDANLLVNGWPSGRSTPQGFTLKPSVASESLFPGKSASFQIAIGGAGDFTGSVGLTANTPSGVKVSFSPAHIEAGGSATATVVVASGTPAMTADITLIGISGSVSETATVSLTVEAAPSLSIVSPTRVVLARGESVAIRVVTTTGGAYSGPVTLAVTGLPKGVIASWNSNGFIESGASVTTSTLTLKAAASVPSAAAALKITASGDGLEAQTLCVVEVNQLTSVRLLRNRPRPLETKPADRMPPALFP
jgi:subtilase family serine protease